jgi:iron complex outermembrane receptor protein
VFDPGGPSEESTNYEEESYAFQPKLIVSTPFTDRLENKMTTGYDYIYYREKRRINVPASLEDIVFASENSHGAYMLDELTMDEHWLLNVGARGVWADFVFNQTQQTHTKFDRSKTTEGYDGGIGYQYHPNSKVFVDYSRSYRLPGLDEFFQSPFPGGPGLDFAQQLNPHLTYQTGNQYQLGIRDNSFQNVHLGFTAAAVQYKNEIYDDPNLGNTNYPARSRHYSQEADISVELFKGKVKPFANATFFQTEFIGGPFSGNQIPDVPDHLAHAGVAWRPLEGLSTTVSTDFVGKRFGIGDEANLFPKVKRYYTVDWSAKYDYKNIQVWVSLNNIFNKHYFAYGSSFGLDFGTAPEIYYPAPGRNVSAGVKVKF